MKEIKKDLFEKGLQWLAFLKSNYNVDDNPKRVQDSDKYEVHDGLTHIGDFFLGKYDAALVLTNGKVILLPKFQDTIFTTLSIEQVKDLMEQVEDLIPSNLFNNDNSTTASANSGEA